MPDETQVQAPDYTKYGADGSEVKKITDNPDAVYNLLLAKRKANGEAHDYRIQLESVAKSTGQTVAEMMTVTELIGKLDSGHLKYSQLDSDEQEIALGLALNDVLDPDKIGIPKSDWEAANKDEGEPPVIEPAKDDKNAEILAENAHLKRVQKFMADGADPKQAEKLARLYDDPKYPEEYLDKKSGKPLDESAIETEKKRIAEEHFKQFRADNPWGFGQPATVPPTHGAPVVPPNGRAGEQSALAEARAKGNVAEMLSIKRKQQQNTGG